MRLSAAPEPADIVWSEFSDARKCCGPGALPWQLVVRASTLMFLVLMLALGSSGCLLIFMGVLGVPGEASMQCSIWSEEVTTSFAWKTACNCFCACPQLQAIYRSTSQCSLQSVESSLAVLACVGVVEMVQAVACWGLRWLMPLWHCAYASELETSKVFLWASAQICAPLSPALGLFTLKWLWSYQLLEPEMTVLGSNNEQLQQLDLAFYLYAAPVVLAWCCLRWLAIIPEALHICRRTRATSFTLWKHYASVISVVGITIVYQPFSPCLASVGAVGMLIRYWSIKSIVFKGAVTAAWSAPTFLITGIVILVVILFWLVF